MLTILREKFHEHSRSAKCSIAQIVYNPPRPQKFLAVSTVIFNIFLQRIIMLKKDCFGSRAVHVLQREKPETERVLTANGTCLKKQHWTSKRDRHASKTNKIFWKIGCNINLWGSKDFKGQVGNTNWTFNLGTRPWSLLRAVATLPSRSLNF